MRKPVEKEKVFNEFWESIDKAVRAGKTSGFSSLEVWAAESVFNFIFAKYELFKKDEKP